MSHVIILSDEELILFKNILSKVNSGTINSVPDSNPKKKSKTELGLDKIRQYRANKARKK